MGPKEAEKVLEILAAMGDLELAMADFYSACGKTWPVDRLFWSNIAAAELLHAENLVQMAKRLRENPSSFELGRPFSTTAIQTSIQGIKGNILKLERGELSRKQVLFLARDIEMSILESKYKELLKTRDNEYNTMLSQIASQTEGHHKGILDRMEALKGVP
jgi:hypothetical protein